MKWDQGRQKTGYLKKTLFISTRFSIDGYLIKYPVGSSIPEHIDPVSDKKHYRLNIVLKQPKNSGLYQGDSFINLFNRIIFFRPDIHKHSVTECHSERLVLSFGLALKKSKP
jgi:hypothetical protein